jgi:hypothetical protein
MFSNEENLTVTALPDGLELYGDFNINVGVDKRSVAANKPLNLTVSIDGVGNIDDIKKYSLDIDGAVIYANAPEIKGRVVGEDYLGSFEQKIVIIADGNYTIPPLTLRYYDRESQREVVKKSDPIVVEVTGGTARAAAPQSTPESKIELAEAIKAKPATETPAVQESNWTELFSASAVSFIVGGLFAWLLIRSRSEALPKKRRESTMAESVKKTKSDKALFELLLPYKRESAVIKNALAELEQNLYYGGTNSVDKKALIDFFNGLPNEPELL